MVRIVGINVPDHKHVEIGLTHIYGIGRSRANKICQAVNVNPQSKIEKLTEVELEKIRTMIGDYIIEGDLRREIAMNIKRMMDLRRYRGLRHRRGLPVNGQRTKTNARTRKGRRSRKSVK